MAGAASCQFAQTGLIGWPMSIWRKISEAVAGAGGSLLNLLMRLTGTTGPRDPEHSVAFTIGMVALGAKMAKADGHVSDKEVAAFQQVFTVAPEDLGNVVRVFNLAKQDVAGYEAYARQIARLFEGRRDVLEDVIDGLFHIAKADGVVHQSEIDYLKSVTAIFGLESCFECLKARHLEPDKADPYVILGLACSANDTEIRAQYRQLVRDNHPDRHMAAGLPEEMIAIATDRLASINAAYDQIALERGL